MSIDITELIPALISPIDNQISVQPFYNFIWAPTQDATSYVLQISRDSKFSPDTTVTYTSIIPVQLVQLLYGTTYYWRVQAKNDTSVSQFSQVRYLQTQIDTTAITDLLGTDFDVDTMYVEYAVSDLSNNRLYFDVLTFDQVNSNDIQSIMVDVKRNLIESNFYIQNSFENTGKYLVSYTVFKNIIGTAFSKALQVTQISSTRKEVKLLLTNISQIQNMLNYPIAYIQQAYPLDFYLNADNGTKFKIVNALVDVDNTLIVKLDQELPQDFAEGLDSWISRKISNPTQETVTLTPSLQQSYPTSLEPDFNSYKKSISANTGAETYATLVPQQLTQSLDLGSMILSASTMVGSTLNTNFTDYSDYVTFGSAQSRLDVFMNKLKTIENYSASISTLNSLNSSASIATINHINYLTTQISTLISQFDLYEKFLYTETPLFASASGGDYDGKYVNFCYPKSSSIYPYALWSTTSPSVSAWYVTQSSLMRYYDNNNPNSLARTIPEYILEDELNKDYVTFVKMIGHYYDNIYVYLKNFLTIYDRSNDIYQGYPKEITYWIGQSIGKELYNDNINANLINYYLGQNISGSAIYTSGSAYPLNANEMTIEIWKRLITSYPHIQKTKGTAQAITAIMSCYGIPETILRIKEYGGHSNLTESLSQEYIYEDFSYALSFNSGSAASIFVPWITSSNNRIPDTIQFRFACPQNIVTQDVDTDIVYAYSSSYNNNRWSIGIRNTTAGSIKPSLKSGYVYFKLSGSSTTMTSSNLTIYDGDYYTVQVTRITGSDSTSSPQTFNLTVAKSDSSRLFVYSNVSMLVTTASQIGAFVSASMLALGNYDNNQFRGTLDEFRLWNKPITQDILSYYIKQPSALVGTSISSSRDDLLFRLSFDYPQSLTTSSYLYNETFVPVYCISASSSGWYNSTHMPYQYQGITRDNITYIPSNGYSKFESHKVRIEKNNLTSNLALTDYKNEVGEFDSNSIESNRLGIFFSPSDIINEQIVSYVGPLSIDNMIGTPDDWMKPQYDAVKSTRNFIYSYIPLYGFYDYLTYISLYNKTVFDSFKDYIPAYVNPTVGVLIESDILDRNKVVIFKSSSMENEVKDTEVDARLHFILFSNAGSILNKNTEVRFSEYSSLTGLTNFSERYADINGISSLQPTYRGSNNVQTLYTFNMIRTSSKQEFNIPGGDTHGTTVILVDENMPAIEPVYTTYTLYKSGQVSLTTNDMNLGIPNFPMYDPTHYRYIGNFRTATQNLKYAGCKITGLTSDMFVTTYDNMFNNINPVQIFNVSKNTVLVDANNKSFIQ
jgi:hypothetical protein